MRRRTRSAAWLVAALVAGAGATRAASAKGQPKAKVPARDEIVEGDPGKRLDAVVKAHEGGAFWGSVLVAKGGKVLLAKGYGAADLDKKPATARSLYDIGSASKQFTAAAVLRLAMQKRLALDDPISKHLADVPEDKAKVTVRHLLHHTGGIPYPAEFGDTTERDAAVALYLASPLASAPGAAFAYSNIGYFLLAAIVERASGKTFDEYVREEVFRKAGLADTGFVDGVGLDAARATARVGRVGGQEIRTTALEYPWNWGQRGATGVVTTVLDLYAWDRALRTDAVLDAASRALLYEPGLGGYGCGWFVARTGRTTKVEHGGATGGYHAQYSRWLEDDAVVVVLTNEALDAAALQARLTELVFPPR